CVITLLTPIECHVVPTGSKFPFPSHSFSRRYKFISGPCRSRLASCGLRHNSIKHSQHECGFSFRRGIESACLKAKERVWQVWEGPEKRITEYFTRAAEPSSVYFPTCHHIRGRSAAPAALLQISADNCVYRSDKLLAMFYYPATQIPNLKGINASILGT